MDRRKVLVASYYFPPAAAVGALRAAKFAKSLPQFGWTPFVLTARDACTQGIDRSRLAGLEHVSILRTRELPRIVELYGKARTRLGFASSSGSPQGAVKPTRVPTTEGLARRLKRLAISVFVYLPDEKKNWSLYAAGAAIRLIRQQQIECVLTSGPPFSTHVIGLIAKTFTGVRWIADFRDPWIDLLENRFPSTRSRTSDQLERWMEAAVVRYADKIVTTTARMRAAMAERYPLVPAERFLTIHNSIDSDRFQSASDVQKYEKFTISYLGALYFDRSPEPLFRAVSAMIREEQISGEAIRIKLVGNCRKVGDMKTTDLVRKYGLQGIVELVDQVPYEEAVRIMQRSHLLLMLAPHCHELVVPAKFFDYLGSGSRILALAAPGATADLIAETRSGQCFRDTDIAGLSAYLSALLADGSFAELRNDPAAFRRYDARMLTGSLVAQAFETAPGASHVATARL